MDLCEAVAFVETHGIALLTAPGSNLTAVAVSTKDHGPITESRDFAVTAFVPRKLSKNELRKVGIEPFDRVFAHAVGTAAAKAIDLDVVESGTAFHPQSFLSVPAPLRGLYGGPPPALDSQKYFHALRCGIGITNPVKDYPDRLSVGTLGFFLRDDKDAYLVSNNHVLGKSSDKGGAKAVLRQAIVQPGTLDLTEIELRLLPTEAALIKELRVAEVAGVVPLQFRTAKTIPVNRVDAAAARLTPPGRPRGDMDRLTFGGGIRGTWVYQADPNDPNQVLGDSRVFKVGRTTGYTEGVVTALAGTAMIDYDGRLAFFAGQLVVKATPDNVGPFSDRGDSGSGVLNARSELVGLLFAGSEQQTLVNPITDVLSALVKELGAAAALVVTP
jgi:S1-C subfamily serine protease